LERGRQFLRELREVAQRTEQDWRQCPRCGSRMTIKYGSYRRRPWFFGGRREVRVQRHRCRACGRTYGEESALLKRGSWYAREVHRSAIDHWLHLGVSLRRTAEVMRSWLGKQERYRMWRPLEPEGEERCYLAASTVHRWLDQAGVRAKKRVKGSLAGIAKTDYAGVDGLWAKLRGGSKRVVLLVADSVTGILFPPVVAVGEGSAAGFRSLFERAQQAGLNLEQLRGVTSDGAKGLLSYLKQELYWVGQQRCVWHLWRNLRQPLAEAVSEAVEGLGKEAAEVKGKVVFGELTQRIHQVLDAATYEQAEEALKALRHHPFGQGIARFLHRHLDDALTHTQAYYQGMPRVTPEWHWRDFRLRLSRGRNHGSEERLERAALLWALYRNFTPAQERYERKRHYRHPGLSPLAVAGFPPEDVSYLDALDV